VEKAVEVLKAQLAAGVKMRALVIACAVCVTAAASAQAPQTAAREIPFDSVMDVLKLPAEMNFGEVAGVALNSKGHIFVYNRGRQTQLFEFDKDGKFLREIGKDLYGFEFAHVVRIDKDDNIWCVDEGSNMVIKFNPEGRVTMLLGRKWEVPEGRPEQPPAGSPPPRATVNNFNRPTDVTWDPAGNIFVADGYNNSRVAKFDKNGNWVKAWGAGQRPGPVQHPAHDRVRCKGNIYVGDRRTGGSRCSTARDVPEAVRQRAPALGDLHHAGANQVLYSSDANSGKIFKLDLNGTLLGTFGAFGKQPKQFGWIHEIACPSENELYVGELLNWRMQKLLLHPPK
jgi:DNA-binding beta-propeller fold protein YncE